MDPVVACWGLLGSDGRWEVRGGWEMLLCVVDFTLLFAGMRGVVLV